MIHINYKKELDKIRWSFSTLHQYEQCPYAFYNKKIDGSETDEGNFYSDSGKFLHDIQADIFTGKLEVENAIDYFMDHYDENVLYEVKQSTMDKKYSQAIDYFASFDIDRLQNYDILGVEKKVLFTVGEYKFIGFIDLLLQSKATGEILLIDHKSSDHFLKKDGSPLKNQLDKFESYSKQMYLYSKAIYDQYGDFPTRIIWNHFFEQSLTNIPFMKEDYEKTLDWAINTIRRIYSDDKFDPVKSHMMCNVLCGYRNSCCYKNTEDGE